MGRRSRHGPAGSTRVTATDDTGGASTWWSAEARSSLASGLVAATIPVVAAIWSVYQVSRGDRDTTMLVLRTLNIPAAVMSTLFYFAPFLLAALFVLIFKRIMESSPGRMRRIKGAAWLTAYTLLSASLPLVYVLSIATAGMIVRPRPSSSRRLPDTAGGRPAYAEMIAYAGLPLMLILTQQPMWLPHEEIRTRNHPDGVTVYVLDSGDHHLTVMYENFQPEIIDQDDVRERRLCRVEPTGYGKVIDILYSTVPIRAKLGQLEPLPACPTRQGGKNQDPQDPTAPPPPGQSSDPASPSPSTRY